MRRRTRPRLRLLFSVFGAILEIYKWIVIERCAVGDGEELLLSVDASSLNSGLNAPYESERSDCLLSALHFDNDWTFDRSFHL